MSTDLLREHAIELLKNNDQGAFTVPSQRLYPHQWAWDSAFAAMGWSHFNTDRAWVELETLFATAWPDGRIPHIYFHNPDARYFPCPAIWKDYSSTSVTQPPMWSTALRMLFSRDPNRERLLPLLSKLDASLCFFSEQRDPCGLGAIAVAHPWESGLDNSPAWDAALERIDISEVPSFNRVDNTVVTEAEQRPDDTTYKRYLALVQEIADNGFGRGSFSVYDPFMTSVVIRAEDDLAWLAKQCDFRSEALLRAKRIREGLEQHLWHPDKERYCYKDAFDLKFIESDTIGCYMPLWCGVKKEREDALREGLRSRFTTPYPYPSTSPTDAKFEPRRYWRGPTWINTNWMLNDAVDIDLAELSLALVENSGFYEYFEAQTGEGLGAESFTWTAALVLEFLAQKNG
ncbi:MAG: hypothetical protein IPJ88_16950 [Myxococcales bacterium]|nr:MAG: hypothetical protein IPJ88_16950 [Myxococcales bacterium]